METWMSWAGFLSIVAVAYWYYNPRNKNNGQDRGRPLQRASDTAKQLVDWDDSEKKSKPNTKASKPKAPRKSVKKSAQEAGNKTEAALTSSSTAGADDDDDNSTAQSPSLVAKVADKAPSGKDVSDMLDPKSVTSVLKIGASEKPTRSPKPQQRSESQTETKKQRQNRQKQEDAKAAREVAEKERKALEEKQRRMAREARGEPARNGLQPSQPPASTPWNRVGAPAATQPVNGQLLDTIDATSTSSSSEAATNGTAPTPDSTSYSNLPSEEDQMREALAESSWTTVPKGKKKKTNKSNGDMAGEGSDSGLSYEPTPAPVKQAPAPMPAAKKENAKSASRYEALSEPITGASHPMDSDWPVV